VDGGGREEETRDVTHLLSDAPNTSQAEDSSDLFVQTSEPRSNLSPGGAVYRLSLELLTEIVELTRTDTT
jgi:hypothetical protein